MDEKKRVPLTRQAYDRLREQLEYLEGEGRTKVIGEIASARSHGDLSENAEYHAAREHQGFQEAEARRIRQMIENAEIIEAADDDVVAPGKLVTLLYDGDDEPETYFFGVREEKGGEFDVLTPDSPLGRALNGHSKGDKVTAEAPKGEIKVEVVDVRPA